MAKKSFKDKEDAFKKKSGISLEEKGTYIPQKTEREKALELLEKKGFKVSIKDNLLYCECKDEEEYDKYKSILIHNFGRDEKVPFSFGASIKSGLREDYYEI